MMLSDTLYRVPRQPGLSMLQTRGPGQSRKLTSRRLVLETGASARYESPDEETVVVLQEGAGALEVAGRRWNVSRSGVCDERATALYLPAGIGLHVTAASPMEAILLSTPAPPHAGVEPVLVMPAEVRVN